MRSQGGRGAPRAGGRELHLSEHEAPTGAFVIETAGRLVPIEVKAGAAPRLADAANLRAFRDEYGKKARAALLLHTGTRVEWLAPDVLAAPWWRIL